MCGFGDEGVKSLVKIKTIIIKMPPKLALKNLEASFENSNCHHNSCEY